MLVKFFWIEPNTDEYYNSIPAEAWDDPDFFRPPCPPDKNYTASPGEVYEESDFFNTMTPGHRVWELGGDTPESIRDIRGEIHNQPQRVFAVLPENGPAYYFGLSEAE